MFIRTVTAMVLAFSVASCSVVGPNYQRPLIPLEARFALDPNSALQAAANDIWWETLADPTLNAVMQRALAQNLDVQASVARIQQAQAQLRAAGPLSQLSGGAEATAQVRLNDDGTRDNAALRIAPTFVLDLFGEATRREERAQATLDAAVFQSAASRLALQLAVVTAYLDLRFFQDLEALRHRAIRRQTQVVNLVRQREALSEETRISMRRSEAELQLQRAQVPESQQGQVAAILRISTLLAEPFSPLQQELSVRKRQPRPASNFAPGLPAALLKNRPDVRSAEADLRAAVAQVGVTEAQLYPTLSLNGGISASGGTTVTLGPSLAAPIFDRNARLAGRDAALARAEEAELAWRLAVLDSVEEVQLNLSQLRTSDTQVTALIGAVSKFREAVGLSRDAFQLQAITHLELLDAEDSLIQTELRLINARRSYALAWAGLNVAIGQGWRAHASDAVAAALLD